MRLGDLSDYRRLRRLAQNPWQIVRFRKKRRTGAPLDVRLSDAHSLSLRGNRQDFRMFRRVYLLDEYRLNGRPPGGLRCILDIGGNVGLFACRAAGLAQRLISYEPAPDNFMQLSRNTAEFPNVLAVNQGVAGKPGTLRVYRPDAQALDHLGSIRDPACEHHPKNYDEVAATTLDDIFAHHSIDHCDLLKVDLEGAECEILYGTSDTVLGKISAICGRYDERCEEEPSNRIAALTAFLKGKGFELDIVHEPGKEERGVIFAERPEPSGVVVPELLQQFWRR
ncbi:MAG: FkbM family methyltransferase [bacterium]|nr:FkbM family methyltransferase [bacterium]